MKIVGYTGNWDASYIAKLIRCCAAHCRYIVLIVKNNRMSDAESLLTSLSPYLDSRRAVDAWPGTISLSGVRSELLKFHATDRSYEILIDTVLPELLQREPAVEDFSLLRDDGRPFFITITHERDAFFKLEQAELDELVASIGAESLVVQGEDEFSEERY